MMIPMKNIKLILICLTVILITSNEAFSQEIIPVSEIKAGMKGIGYTIVSGTNVEPFDIEVVSILKKSWNTSDAILIRLSGLNLEHSGTVAGMSGSPIYIDGKLAGALAFGWQYAKDPIAGVTPIEEMYKLYEDPNTTPIVTTSMSQNSLVTPLVFEGFDSFAFAEYKDDYIKMGFHPIQIGGGIGGYNPSTNFLFGDAAAIVLIDGDISMAGIGTVSHTDDEKFLLFGHSMFSKGELKAPVAKAFINSVIASRQLSFKLGAAYSNYVGYTTYDGAFGISGVYGDIPDNMMIPIELDIEDQDFLSRTLNFRIINDPTYFSKLLGQSVLSAMKPTAGGDEEGVFSIGYEIYTDYFDEPYKINHRVVSYSSAEAYKSLLETLLAPVNFFAYNTIDRVGITSIKMSIKRSNIRYASLTRASLIEEKAKAGERIHLKLTIQEYGSPETNITIPIDLPISLSTGIYTIFAGNEYMYNAAEQTFMPNKYIVRNLEDVMTVFNKSFDDSKLKVWLYSSDRGVSVNGNNYPNLPQSYYGILARDNTTDKAAYISSISSDIDLPYPILGLLNIKILVEGTENYENR